MQKSDRVERRMKLRDLHILLTVVQAGSMSKAAALLNTGQPAISRSIAELERELGVRLLERNREGVTPTACGRAMLEGGTAVFDDLRQTVKNIEFLTDPTVGEVRVGCNPFLAASFVSSVVNQVSRRYPRVIFHLVTAYVQTLHRELAERSVDFLIARKYGTVADERLNYEFLFNESYLVAVGAQNPLARRRTIDLSDLVNEPWVLPPPESTLGSVLTEAFRATGLDYPRATVIAEPLNVRISMLGIGRFVSIFPSSVLRFSVSRSVLKVLPVKQSLGRVPIEIVTLKNRVISPLAQLFINSTREAAKNIRTNKRYA